jgi:hypothetical protein
MVCDNITIIWSSRFPYVTWSSLNYKKNILLSSTFLKKIVNYKVHQALDTGVYMNLSQIVSMFTQQNYVQRKGPYRVSFIKNSICRYI